MIFLLENTTRGTVKIDAEAIEPLLMNNGLTLTGLARKAGLTPNVVINAVRHGNLVLPITAKKIADVLGRNASDIACMNLH